MREIKFRGKRKDNGEWVYGYLFKIWEQAFILWGTTNDSPNMIEVIPETVGQFTDLEDKNGVEIYEGDKVKVPALTLPPGEGGYVQNETIQTIEFKVLVDGMYDEMLFAGFSLRIGEVGDDRDDRICEVIGNIHQEN